MSTWHLSNYLMHYEMISKYQSGFQRRDSTVYQLINIYHNIIENMDRGKDVRFVFCNVSKAFDRVWHKGLIYQLQTFAMMQYAIN